MLLDISKQSLNPQQAEAVDKTAGPLLILAGAGTGKTKVLTSRIINIVNSGLALPYQILAVTFTNKAANEMKNRISKEIGDQVYNLWVGTFHSVASKILRRNPELLGLTSDFTIIDDDDQNRLIRQILTDLNIDPKQFPTKSYLNKISRSKDTGKSGFEGTDIALPQLSRVFEIYQERLKNMNAVDFGDLLLHNLTLFRKAPEVLSYYQDKFLYILVDEYQDTNNTQYQWLLSLASKRKNICCVGDDDQSIYGWRGANISNILRFEKDFEGAKVVRLEQNYRSSANIIAAARSVISHNKERHGKNLWTQAGAGEKIKIYSFADDRTEAYKVAQMTKDVIAQRKFFPKDIAILVRAGYQTRSFEESFIQNSVQYKVIGGIKFYERAEIRDSIAYLRICANNNDDLALSRVINVPRRGVGNTTILELQNIARQSGLSFFGAVKKAFEEGMIKGKAKDALTMLIGTINRFQTRINQESLSIIAQELLNETGYIAMLKAENTIESQGRLENIQEFINSLADFKSIQEFLEYVSLMEIRDDKTNQESVSIMTVHAAKGLEFDLVFVPGLEDGIFPSAKSIDERNGLEEERRLAYVAITRARKELILSHANSRFVFGDMQIQMPSRFLQELPEENVTRHEFNIGSQRKVSNYSGNYQSRSTNNYSGDYQARSPELKSRTSEFSSNANYYSKPKENSWENRWENNSPHREFEGEQEYSTRKLYKSPMMNVKIGSYKSSQNLGFSAPGSATIRSNQRVSHKKFGSGKVLSVDGERIEVAFDSGERKILMKNFLSFE